MIVVAVVFGFGFLDDAFLPADFGGALAGLERRGRAAAGRAHGKRGKLLFEVLALAGRTRRRVARSDQRLKQMPASPAAKIKQWHGPSTIYLDLPAFVHAQAIISSSVLSGLHSHRPDRPLAGSRYASRKAAESFTRMAQVCEAG